MTVATNGPYLLMAVQIMEAYERGEIEIVTSYDTGLTIDIDTLSDSARAKFKKRCDEFEPLIARHTLVGMLFDRSTFFEKLKTITCVKHRQARRLLCAYLIHNNSKRAFAQNYSPGKGKRRHKFGKPKSISVGATDKVRSIEIPERDGFKNKVYLSDVIETIRASVNKHGIYGALTLNAAYMRMIMEDWPQHSDWITNSQGDREHVIKDPEHVPTLDQYIYVRTIVLAEKDAKEVEALREARSRAVRMAKGPRGGANYRDITGPGQRFELDSSKKQVRMVSSLGDGRILLPATIYQMVDVFSGLIVAAILSPRNPSLSLAMYFLRLCFKAKFHLFQRLGLKYTDQDFPCKEAPAILSVDRAEFLGNRNEVTVFGGITIQVAPPMSPWDKGMVENRFNQLKKKELAQPGRYRKFMVRRENDGRADAGITYALGQRLLWDAQYELNRLPIHRDLIPDGMLRDGYRDISHIQAFRWGRENRYTYLRELDQNEVDENFSFRERAVVSAGAISFKNQTYNDPRVSHPTVPIVIEDGVAKTDIIYDDYFPEIVRFKCEDKWVTATTRSRSVIEAGATIWDVEAFSKNYKESQKFTQGQASAVTAQNAISNEPLVKAAVKDAKQSRAKARREGGTAKQRVRSATAVEAERQRQQQLVETIHADALSAPAPPSESIETLVDSDPAPVTTSSPDIQQSVGSRSSALMRRRLYGNA